MQVLAGVTMVESALGTRRRANTSVTVPLHTVVQDAEEYYSMVQTSAPSPLPLRPPPHL